MTAHGGTGSTTWSRAGGALPAGVSLDATGVLSGTPAAVGTFTATVVASDANWSGNTATANVTPLSELLVAQRSGRLLAEIRQRHLPLR